MSSNTEIGVKRMGELDNKPFHEAMKRKYNEADAEDRAIEVCSIWEEYLRDPEWHPFKVITINGKSEVYTLQLFEILHAQWLTIDNLTLVQLSFVKTIYEVLLKPMVHDKCPKYDMVLCFRFLST